MAEETTPVEFLPSHLPRTELEQLTAALQAGLITPELFALAKEKLLRPAVSVTEAPVSTIEAQTSGKETAANEGIAAETDAEGLPPLASLFDAPAPAAPVSAAPTPAPELVPEVPVVAVASAASVSPPKVSSAPPGPPAIVKVEPVAQPIAPPAAPPVPRPPDTYDALLANHAPAPAAGKGRDMPPLPSEQPASPTWPKVVLVAAILGLLFLIYQQVAGSHPDEQLTTPAAPVTAPPAPKAAKTSRHSRRATKAIKPKSAEARKLSLAAKPTPVKPTATAAQPRLLTKSATPTGLAGPPKPVAATKPAASPVPASTPAEPAPQPVPAAAEAGDNEGTTRVRAMMAAYYADILAPPFHAAQYFAPRVERLYIQQNLTPADIETNFERNFFPDNKQAVLQIEPGSLRVSAAATDGTRVATFTEASRIYHPSRHGYQRLRAQVRARFDADYHIVYLRQERLLESTFE